MAFPVTGILDDFNRADTGPPPSASWTNGIEGGTGGMSVVSNALQGVAGTDPSAYWNTILSGADCESYVTITTLSASVYCWGRITTPGSVVDGYMAQWLSFSPDVARLFRIDGDGFTQLGSSSLGAWTNGDKLGLEIIGSNLKAYRFTGGSWASVVSTSDATHSAAGYIGLKSTGAAVLDNFGGGALTATLYSRTSSDTATTFGETIVSTRSRVKADTAASFAETVSSLSKKVAPVGLWDPHLSRAAWF